MVQIKGREGSSGPPAGPAPSLQLLTHRPLSGSGFCQPASCRAAPPRPAHPTLRKKNPKVKNKNTLL